MSRLLGLSASPGACSSAQYEVNMSRNSVTWSISQVGWAQHAPEPAVAHAGCKIAPWRLAHAEVCLFRNLQLTRGITPCQILRTGSSTPPLHSSRLRELSFRLPLVVHEERLKPLVLQCIDICRVNRGIP